MLPAKPDDSNNNSIKLRILFISRALPIHRLGGLEYHLRDLAAGLIQRGHEVHILTTAGGQRETSISGATIYELPNSKSGDYSLGFFRRAGAEARKLTGLLKPNIICPIDMAALFINPSDFTVPIIPIIHGTMTSEVTLDWRYRRYSGIAGRLSAIWRHKARCILEPTFRRMLQRVDRIIVDSEFTRRELLFENVGKASSAWAAGSRSVSLARKVFVVPLGIDFDRYPKPVETNRGYKAGDTLRICMLGRLQEQKGIGQAIRAAASLVTRGVRFKMSIGGSGDYESFARRLIRELDLAEYVCLRGRIEPDDLAAFFAENDVFLLPDLTQPAFGLVAVEAMHYGLPVVAANVGAVPEVVSDTCGWLYNPWDVEELAGLIMHLHDSPGEVNQKAGCVRDRALKYTLENMAHNTEAVFANLSSSYQNKK